MKYISWNTRKRRMISFYAVFIIVIIFSIVLSYFHSGMENMETEVDNTQGALLRQVSQNIELRLSNIDKMLINICEREEVEAYFSATEALPGINPALKKDTDALVGCDKAVESVYFYSKNNNSIFANGRSYTKDEFYDKDWLEEAKGLVDKREIWTTPRRVYNPIINATSSVFTMLRTYPLITTPEKIQGYIAVNISSEILNQIVAESPESVGTGYMILDTDNNVLAKSNTYFTYAEEDILTRFSQKPETTFSVEAGGKTFFVKYMSFSWADWKIMSVTPYNTLLEKVRTFRNTNIFIALAVSIFMLGTIILTNQWMNAPVDRFLNVIVRNVEKDERHKLNNFEEIGNMFLYMATQQKDLQRQLDVNIPYIKYSMISNILSRNAVSYDEMRAQMSLMKINLYPANYIVMLMDLDNKDIIDVTSPDYGMDVYISSLYNKAEELINQENRGFATQQPDKMCVCIMSFENDNARQNAIAALEIAQHLSDFMREYYGVSITVSIGEHYNDFNNISTSYDEAARLIKYKSILGKGSIITCDDVTFEDEADYQKHNSVREKLVRAFESASVKTTISILDELFDDLKKEKRPQDVIIRLAMQVLRECMEIYRLQGFEISDEHYRNIDISLNQLETADEIKSFMYHLLDEMLIDMSEKTRSHGGDELVVKIVDYVNSEFSECNMSLNLIADKFSLSVPYLSKIFKNYTNKTFTEYLIEIRIKKAADLLVNSNKKVNEIAEAVGYPNTSSFIRIFKKYYYQTPVDYRNRHR